MSDVDDRLKDEVAAWQSAEAQTRDVVKWIAASFGALGALLIGTAPLSGLAKVEPHLITVALLLVFGGLGLGAVAYIVWTATSLLTPSWITLPTVATDKAFAALRLQVATDPSAHLGSWATSIPDFVEARQTEYTVLANIVEQKERTADASTVPALEAAEKVQTERIESAGRVTKRLLAMAGFVDVTNRFDARKPYLFGAAVVVIIGIVGFLVTVNASQKPDKKAPEPTQAPALVSPVSKNGALAKTVGATCPTPFEALVLEGGNEGPWTLLITDANCNKGTIYVAADEAVVLLTYAR